VDILCIQQNRVVARDNTVTYEGRVLQLPSSPARAHYVKANVRVHEYPDGTRAVFHGPRRLARYDAEGREITDVPTIASVMPCSPSSRRGLAMQELVQARERRPALTASARGVHETCAGRDEETVPRSNIETDQDRIEDRDAASGMTSHPAGASTASEPAQGREPRSGQMMCRENRTTAKATDTGVIAPSNRSHHR
jgi:hypothetical protein